MTNLCLAVECATARGSVALVDEHGVRAVRDWDVPERHAESVLPAIEAVLDEAGVRFDQVAVMGVDVGPGSFTGVRVALATVKGLAFAHRIPVVGVNSLEVLAVGAAAGDADWKKGPS
ncbi:MAG: tRNA (adenosine(37)-N6)-threonylcarbamoyltransferase complex dimerization subunit type 1 TsaB [Polyangiales bacterium]